MLSWICEADYFTHPHICNSIFSIKYLAHYKLGIVDLKYKAFFFNFLSSQDISLTLLY